MAEDLVQRLRRGAVAYTTPTTVVHAGPTSLEREALRKIIELQERIAALEDTRPNTQTEQERP